MIQNDVLLAARTDRRMAFAALTRVAKDASGCRVDRPRIEVRPRRVGVQLHLLREGKVVLTLRPGECAEIGRSQLNSVVLLGSSVSRRHALIRWDDCDPFPTISNLSPNKTRLNGSFLDQAAKLRGNEEIVIEDHTLVATLITRSQPTAQTRIRSSREL